MERAGEDLEGGEHRPAATLRHAVVEDALTPREPSQVRVGGQLAHDAADVAGIMLEQ